MIVARHCSKPGCNRPAVATLTYDYSGSTVVLGPLSTVAEPHSYDMCEEHANHLTAPQGWQVVRLQTQFEPAPPSPDDLMALADAVREAAHRSVTPPATRRGMPDQSSPLDSDSAYARRRSHFQVVSGLERPDAESQRKASAQEPSHNDGWSMPDFGPFTPHQ